jgi:hypothetical protein
VVSSGDGDLSFDLGEEKDAVPFVLDVRVGRERFVHIEGTKASDGGSRSHAWYGPRVQGVAEVELTVSATNTVSGTVDGRRIVPFVNDGTAESFRSVVFEDGGLVPQWHVDERVNDTVRSLMENARSAMASCGATRQSRQGQDGTAGLPPVRLFDDSYSHGGQHDDTKNSVACVVSLPRFVDSCLS